MSPMRPDIRNHPLVSTRVTSARWMIVRRKKPKHFGQHWPQPVPPYAVNPFFSCALIGQRHFRERQAASRR